MIFTGIHRVVEVIHGVRARCTSHELLYLCLLDAYLNHKCHALVSLSTATPTTRVSSLLLCRNLKSIVTT
jgi:hypothetical protein